ncbi:hypothetical protein [Hydrogenophaga sp. ANAO-22]|uniref:hypothetical protein n=1 Tax=Hydrogenophaga sp. ANAO-22 TaxID=3166645 RepID=UPI0036D256D0
MSDSRFLVDWSSLGRALIEWVNPYADALLVWLSDAQHRVNGGVSSWLAEVPDVVWAVAYIVVSLALLPFVFRWVVRAAFCRA